MKHIISVLALAIVLSAVPSAVRAQFVNEDVSDAAMAAEFSHNYDGTSTLDAVTDIAGPGVRFQASPTVGSGSWKIGISDDYPVSGTYGFPQNGSVSGWGDWSGYTAYQLHFLNNGPGWVYAKVYFNTTSSGYYNSSGGIWIAPGDDGVDTIYLVGIPYLDQISNFGFELFTNYGTGAYEATSFDVTVTAEPIPATNEVWVDGAWAGSNPGQPVGAGPYTYGYNAFDTIQDGIDNVSGSIVNVAPGTYAGGITITHSVQILGSGDGSNPGADTIVSLLAGQTGFNLLAGGNSAVDRLEIRDLRVTGGSRAIYTDSAVDYLTFDNLTLTGASTYGIEIHNSAVVNDVVMTDCDLVGNATAMRVRGQLDGLVMTDGHLDGNTNGLYSVAGAPYIFRNVSVSGTTFDNNSNKGMYLEMLSDATFDGISVASSGTSGSFAAGIDINLKGSAYQNIAITNSSVTGCGAGDPVNGVGITIKARDDGSYAGTPATLTNVDLSGCTITGNQNGLRFGEPGKNNAGPTAVDVHQCDITGNLGTGLDNQTLATDSATCNWWGTVLGPNDPPANISSGDAVAGTVTYSPWLDGSISGTPACNQTGNPVTPDPESTCLTAATPCNTVSFDITRTDAAGMRAFSVTFQLSSELELCTGSPGDIAEGTYLSGVGGTNFQVLDNTGGSYTVDCAILGLPCGATAATGTLFTVNVKASGTASSEDTGTITVTSVTFRDCSNAPIPGTAGGVGTLDIDTSAPAAIGDLAAVQVKTGNGSDGTTNIDLSWSAVTEPDADVIEIYRAGYGDYPEYDDGTGTVPATPSYPPSGAWTYVATVAATATSYSDEPATRDFWYYTAFVKDLCGNVSGVSNQTGGTLNYHLGDVTNGSVNGQGDNLVSLADISHLGANYGATLVFNDPFNYLDVGPTTDYSVDARPTTDNQLQFEDLILFAINYGAVSKPGMRPAGSEKNAVSLEMPSELGGTFEVGIEASSDGTIQGMTLPLRWNGEVVEPIGFTEGEFAGRQGGQVLVLSPKPGTVDAAVFGSTLRGSGELARVRFHRIAAGDPGIGFGAVEARDGQNKKVELGMATAKPGVALTTRLLPSAPNPFQASTGIRFSLKEAGHVRVDIFSTDGRLVRTLMDGGLPAGERTLTWDGRDGAGREVASGSYVIRFVTPQKSESQRIVRLR